MRSSDAPVAGDLDGAEETDRARFGAHDHARPRRVDRLASDANLRVRMAVVLQDFYSALACGFFQFIGESDAGAKRQIVLQAPRALRREVRRMPSSRTSSTMTGFSGTTFGGTFRQPTAHEIKKAGPQDQDPPYVHHAFYRYQLPATSHQLDQLVHLLFRRRESPCRAAS